MDSDESVHNESKFYYPAKGRNPQRNDGIKF